VVDWLGSAVDGRPWTSCPSDDVHHRMDEVSLTDLIGADHLHSSVAIAVEHCRERG